VPAAAEMAEVAAVADTRPAPTACSKSQSFSGSREGMQFKILEVVFVFLGMGNSS
jgi:hypothetical protein